MTHPASTFSRTAVPRPSTAVLPAPEISLRNATQATLPRTTGSTAVWAYRRPSRGASSGARYRSRYSAHPCVVASFVKMCIPPDRKSVSAAAISPAWKYCPRLVITSLTAARSGFGVRWADASAGTNTTGTDRSRSEIVEDRLLYMSSIPSKKWNLASGDSGARS